MGLVPTHATPLHEDNQSTIRLAENPEFRERSKHINVKYHLVRHMVEAKIVEMRHVAAGTGQVADISDILTKPLEATAFHHHRVAIGVVELDVPDIPE